MSELKACMYLRLSRDDGDEGESNSISNQRQLISDYANKLDIEIVSEYVDDGYSGSNFDRPNFKKMMIDLEKRNFNIIIVKDLYRFGRDYIETGKYLQKIFPEKDVRFISVNDNYDSNSADVSDTHLVLPIKNFINDSYCRDISMKVKSSQKVKRQRGEFIGSFAPYGYVKSETEKNQLIVDEKVSHIVKKIFKMKIEGYSSKAIADNLTELGILTPKAYKDSQGVKFSTVFNKGLGKWDSKMINRIIENEVYTGVLIQGKTAKLNYKSKKVVNVLKDDWIIVRNTHEAIVSETQYKIANKMMTRDVISTKGVELLSGLLYCKDCGHQLSKRLSRLKSGVKTSYICGEYNKTGNCTRHSISEEILLQVVEKLIREHIKLQESLYNELLKMDLKDSHFQFDVDDLIEKKSRYEKLRKTLYLDLEDELITEEEFETFRAGYQEKILEIDRQIKNREDLYLELKEVLKSKERFIKHLEQYKELKELDRYSLVMLIDKIYVSEHKKGEYVSVDVVFNDTEKIDILKKILEGTNNKKETKPIVLHNFLINPLVEKKEMGVRVHA